MAIRELSYPEGLPNPYSDPDGRELYAASRFVIDADRAKVLESQDYPLILSFLKERGFSYRLIVFDDGTAEWRAEPLVESIDLPIGAGYRSNSAILIHTIDEYDPIFLLESTTPDGGYIMQTAYQWFPNES